MPCSFEYDKIEPRKHQELLEKTYLYKSALCAILHELDRREIAASIIDKASENGQIDIMPIWLEHKAEDLKRLNEDLTKYSNDEIQMIKHLLRDDEQ